MKQLLFITTSSLASNPRLVKEFTSLKTKYKCYVICFRHNDWSLEMSSEIIRVNSEIEFYVIDRQQKVIVTFLSKLIHKIAIIINPFFKTNVLVASYATNDRTFQLYHEAKNVIRANKINRVIAHNLPPFFVATKLAVKNNLELQLDVEDYHISDPIYFNSKHEFKNRENIMRYAFLSANAITYASEGIRLECEKNFHINSKANKRTIINSFYSKEFLEPDMNTNQSIRLVWFSQNINADRGLEQLFLAANNHRAMEFHVIGNVNQDYLESMSPTDNVIFHKPMVQQDLHKFIGTMDIGLALEPGKNNNNNIALSNKLIAYAQTGLYVLATDTFGQRNFLNNLEVIFGNIIKSNLTEELLNLDQSLLEYDRKLMRWEKAKQFSYDVEVSHLEKLINY